MGLFHKTLKDVEKEFNKGNYKAALKIIEQHINKEHSLRGTFANLNEFNARFTGELVMLEGALIDIIKEKPSKINQQDFKNSLKGARGYINEMIPYAENFLKLCKEEE